MSALDPILRGVAASAVGTFAMDASIYRRYRHGGGTESFPAWESSEGLASWEKAPAPARVAKRFLEGVLKRDVPPRYVRLLNNATHWGFGLAAGAGYGLLVPMIPTKLSHLMAGLIPDAEIRIYPDAAHGVLFQYPGEVAADVDTFLARDDGRAAP